MTTYRIRDWQRHFENNRTRELKVMAWVPVPNKMDGDGYTELVTHPSSAISGPGPALLTMGRITVDDNRQP